MTNSTVEIPTCSVKIRKKQPPCGQQMVPVGSPDNFVYVCPKCDRDKDPDVLLQRQFSL